VKKWQNITPKIKSCMEKKRKIQNFLFRWQFFLNNFFSKNKILFQIFRKEMKSPQQHIPALILFVAKV
jgi:hypothetical protein